MPPVPATSAELTARSAPRAPMTRGLRATVLAAGALLWLTGALWLGAHFAFPQRNEFGALPNPWEAPLMRVHGLISVAAVFLFGWIGAGHILPRWSAAAQRVSGLWLGGCAIVLVVSGYALYYTTDPLHTGAAVLHEALGLLAIVAAGAHWRRIRAARG
jgi:hypothetical protein